MSPHVFVDASNLAKCVVTGLCTFTQNPFQQPSRLAKFERFPSMLVQVPIRGWRFRLALLISDSHAPLNKSHILIEFKSSTRMKVPLSHTGSLQRKNVFSFLLSGGCQKFQPVSVSISSCLSLAFILWRIFVLMWKTSTSWVIVSGQGFGFSKITHSPMACGSYWRRKWWTRICRLCYYHYS